MGEWRNLELLVKVSWVNHQECYCEVTPPMYGFYEVKNKQKYKMGEWCNTL